MSSLRRSNPNPTHRSSPGSTPRRQRRCSFPASPWPNFSSASARCRTASERTCWQRGSTACWTSSSAASLHFDTSAARRYADLAVKARAAGKGFPTPDGYIAAIAAAHGFAVASRDTQCVQCRGSDGDRSLDRDGLMECRAEPFSITVTPISRPVVKSAEKFFWQRQLPTSFIGRFQLLCSYRARFFG